MFWVLNFVTEICNIFLVLRVMFCTNYVSRTVQTKMKLVKFYTKPILLLS